MNRSEILERIGIKEEFYFTSPLVHAVVCMLENPGYDPYKIIGTLLERVSNEKILKNDNLLFKEPNNGRHQTNRI